MIDYQKFMIGTLEDPTTHDSVGRDGKWRVNCINRWAATLGMKLNPRNAVIGHLVSCLHEITHAMSGVTPCDPATWDPLLERILIEIHNS